MIIAAHGNTLRALMKHLDNISEKDILELNIPTGDYDMSKAVISSVINRILLFCHIFLCYEFSVQKVLHVCWKMFLADRTNGRAYATVLLPSSSVCLSSVTLCIVGNLWLNGAS